MSQSPTSSPLDLSSSTLPETAPTVSQQSTSQQSTNIPSDYLDSTPISEQIREILLINQQPQNALHIG